MVVSITCSQRGAKRIPGRERSLLSLLLQIQKPAGSEPNWVVGFVLERSNSHMYKIQYYTWKFLCK